MMERVALSAGRCGSECVEYSLAVQILFKSLFLYAYTLIITTAFIIGYAISINFTDLDYLILIVCSIAAALLFTIQAASAPISCASSSLI